MSRNYGGVHLINSFSSWQDVFKYLANDYMDKENMYVNGGDKVNPDVIVPSSSIQHPGRVSKFKKSSTGIKSYDLGQSSAKRDQRARCSIQVRVYENGQKMYENLGHDGFIGGKQVSERISKDYPNEELYYVQLNWHNPQAGSTFSLERIREGIAHLFKDVAKVHIPGLTMYADDGVCDEYEDIDCR